MRTFAAQEWQLRTLQTIEPTFDNEPEAWRNPGALARLRVGAVGFDNVTTWRGAVPTAELPVNVISPELRAEGRAISARA